MYPFGPYQQPPVQSSPFLKQVLHSLQGTNAPSQGMSMFAPVPYQQAGGLVNSITKVHKGLQVVQQVLPIWKQYAPVIKNAPMLIDMAKIMLADDEPVDEEVNEQTTHEPIKKNNEKEVEIQTQHSEQLTKTYQESNELNGLPTPKLYI